MTTIQPQGPQDRKVSLPDSNPVQKNFDDFKKNQQYGKKISEKLTGNTPRERYQRDVILGGKPLITKGYTRTVNGQQVTLPSAEPLSVEDLQKGLKNKKLDKDTRKLYELELKRQQQGGFLTLEQADEWIEIQNRQAVQSFQNMKDILNKGF